MIGHHGMSIGLFDEQSEAIQNVIQKCLSIDNFYGGGVDYYCLGIKILNYCGNMSITHLYSPNITIFPILNTN